jgi:hypothetical protein
VKGYLNDLLFESALHHPRLVEVFFFFFFCTLTVLLANLNGIKSSPFQMKWILFISWPGSNSVHYVNVDMLFCMKFK